MDSHVPVVITEIDCVYDSFAQKNGRALSTPIYRATDSYDDESE